MDEGQETTTMKGKFTKYKIVKQAMLIFIWVNMGLYIGMIGPSLPDLKAYIGVNNEEIARSLAGQSAGYFLGSFIGGILHEVLYAFNDVLITVELLLWAVGIFLIPWMGSILSLAAALFICGLSVGAVNAGGNTAVLHLWGSQAASPMHSLHFGFGIGGIVAPQLAHFLVPSTEQEMELMNHTLSNITITTNSTTIAQDESDLPKLLTVFCLVGGLLLVALVLMFILTIIGPPKDYPKRKGTKSVSKLFSPKSCTDQGAGYGGFLFLMLFMYYFHTVGGENMYREFLFTYAIESDAHLTKSQAAMLSSVFWACFISGRGISTFISKFVSQRILISVEILGLVVAAVILSLFSTSNAYVLWVCTGIIGLLVSPLFPGGLSWINLHLKMNSVGVMICILGSSSGVLSYVYMAGYFIQYHSLESLFYIMTISGVIMAATFAAMEGIVYWKKSKTKIHTQENSQDSPEEKHMMEKL